MSESFSSSTDHGEETRYQSCLELESAGVPYVIWFEDALVHYEVPTVVFDLYILVSDIEAAGNVLVKAGWTDDTESPHRIGDADVDIPQRPLISPDQQTKTVLLLALDWKFPLGSDTPLERVPLPQTDQTVTPSLSPTVSFPPLPGLLDALIESWLAGPSEDPTLLLRLGCYFNYLYEYVLALKERSFAEQMRYEHRQFHFYVLSGMASSTFPFREHQRGIRDELLRGTFELKECSASRDNAVLFGGWGDIRLPDPVEEESEE